MVFVISKKYVIGSIVFIPFKISPNAEKIITKAQIFKIVADAFATLSTKLSANDF